MHFDNTAHHSYPLKNLDVSIKWNMMAKPVLLTQHI